MRGSMREIPLPLDEALKKFVERSAKILGKENPKITELLREVYFLGYAKGYKEGKESR